MINKWANIGMFSFGRLPILYFIYFLDLHISSSRQGRYFTLVSFMPMAIIYLRYQMKKAFIQLHIAVFLAGFTAILGKLIQLNEGLLVFYRLLIAIIVLGGLLLVKKQLPRLPVKQMLKIAWVGVMVAFHWVAFYGSIKYANVSVALVCFSATGFFTALLEPLILRRKPDMVEVILGLLVIAGIIIVFDFHPHYKLGILFGMAAAVGSAIFPILNKQLLLQFTPKVLTWYEFAAGFLFLCLVLPVYFIFFPPAYYLPTTMDWLWLALLAVICTIIMFDLQLQALKKISAFTVNLSYNLEPVYGIILAFFIFDESKFLHIQFYIGLALILLSILINSIRQFRKAKKAKLMAAAA